MPRPENLLNLPEYPIHTLSNTWIARLQNSGAINITPWNPDLLKPTAYRLFPEVVRYYVKGEDEGLERSRFVRLKPDAQHSYIISPREYVIVSISETITLAPGLTGTFFPASQCIEHGLIFLGGRLDAGYNRSIVFGIHNASEDEVPLTSSFELARVAFSWLGNENIPSYDQNPPDAYLKRILELRQTITELGRSEAEAAATRARLATELGNIERKVTPAKE